MWWDATRTVVVGSNTSTGTYRWLRGAENSGTNFVLHAFHMNGYHALRNADEDAGTRGCWKHTPPWWVMHVPTIAPVGVLAIVRHPISWVESMQKTHYDIDCANWTVGHNCSMTARSMHSTNTLRQCPSWQPTRTQFLVLEDMWTAYVAGFFKGTFGVTQVVRHEDVVMRPNDLWKRLRLPYRDDIRLPTGPSKTHGLSTNLAFQRLRLSQSHYNSPSLTRGVVRRICRSTIEMRQRLGYACTARGDRST